VKGRREASSSGETDTEAEEVELKPSHLVAVKLTPKAKDGDVAFAERTLVSFIREVEILEVSHSILHVMKQLTRV
jgi:hypothetical protein